MDPIQNDKIESQDELTVEDLQDIRKNLLNQVSKVDEKIAKLEKVAEIKFILILPPTIDKYLAWATSEHRMHKAQLVRGAIEETMLKDKEYQQFLAENA